MTHPCFPRQGIQGCFHSKALHSLLSEASHALGIELTSCAPVQPPYLSP